MCERNSSIHSATTRCQRATMARTSAEGTRGPGHQGRKEGGHQSRRAHIVFFLKSPPRGLSIVLHYGPCGTADHGSIVSTHSYQEEPGGQAWRQMYFHAPIGAHTLNFLCKDETRHNHFQQASAARPSFLRLPKWGWKPQTLLSGSNPSYTAENSVCQFTTQDKESMADIFIN